MTTPLSSDPFYKTTCFIDGLTKTLSTIAMWGILFSCLISVLNALSRKFFGISSNAWLEMQWYLYAGSFLMCSAEVLRQSEHVRIDIIYQKFPAKAKDWLDRFAFAFCVFPVCAYITYLSASFLGQSLVIGEVWSSHHAYDLIGLTIKGFFTPSTWEMSSNAGGLPTWPAKLMMLLGFGLLSLQSVCEFLKTFHESRADETAENVRYAD